MSGLAGLRIPPPREKAPRAPLPFPQGLTQALSRLDRQARILDFGCGDGRSLVPLLAEGWDVWGVDITQPRIVRAPDPARLLVLQDGRAPFDDASFDLVFSNQVLEHVENLEPVIAEVARLTKPGGIGLHEWPAKWRPGEPHFAMPLVHWLPKNRVRYAAIYACLTAGIYPPAAPPNQARRELAEMEYRYSVNETFYRSIGTVSSTFAAYPFEVELVPHSRIARAPLGPLRPIADWGVRTFRTATLRTQRLDSEKAIEWRSVL